MRVPELLKAPPFPEVWAPETVTPEMDKSPSESMLKILKLRVELFGFVGSLPLMVSEGAPRPVIVRVPELDASKMLGSAEFKMIM